LTWEDIDLERGIIQFVEQKKRAKKGNKKFQSVILPELEEYLRELLVSKKPEPSEPLFPKLSKTGISGDTGLSETFIEMVEAAGIEQKKTIRATEGGKGRNFNALTFHSLKHTFISLMANNGVRRNFGRK